MSCVATQNYLHKWKKTYNDVPGQIDAICHGADFFEGVQHGPVRAAHGPAVLVLWITKFIETSGTCSLWWQRTRVHQPLRQKPRWQFPHGCPQIRTDLHTKNRQPNILLLQWLWTGYVGTVVTATSHLAYHSCEVASVEQRVLSISHSGWVFEGFLVGKRPPLWAHIDDTITYERCLEGSRGTFTLRVSC